ncbi:MAG: ABC transporter ATP-binding protein [Hyphomicrobiaceae bacterium]
MIRFDAVKKAYNVNGGRRVILHNLNLTLPRANIGFLGANGAGKSTLLRLIAGTELPDSGTIVRQGRISWPLGFAGSFNGSLSGVENVRFVARIYGQDTERVLAFVEEFSELGEFYRMPVGSYSSGMRARLAFGVSMAIAFDYYLVDEITAVGDDNFRRKCRDAFREKLSDARIIMVSHSSSTLRDYCETGAVIKDGHLTFYPDIKDAFEEHDRNMRAPRVADARAEV